MKRPAHIHNCIAALMALCLVLPKHRPVLIHLACLTEILSCMMLVGC